MKRIHIFFALLLLSFSALAQNGGTTVMTGSQTQTVKGQKIFLSTGAQGTPLVAWSQSGASAFVATQDLFFDQPAVLIQRTGTDGDIAETPTLQVRAGRETAWNMPIFQVDACLALSGDNHLIVYGDAALVAPAILDKVRLLGGVVSIDPTHRALVGDDGITPIATWSNGVFATPHLSLTGTVNIGDVVVTGNTASLFNAIKQTATTASAGVVQLATGMEVESGEDAVKAVTPWTLKATKDLAQGSLQRSFNLADIDDPFAAFNAIKQDAATNFSGVVQLATQAEVNAGTDAVKPVTPSTLSGAGYIKSIPAGNTPASLFSQLGEIIVWKPENTTRANTTTKTNDPHLAVNLEAGKTYMVRGQLAYMCSSATPGFSSAISFSGSWAYSGGVVSNGITNTAWSSFSYPDSYASSFATALFTFSRSAQNSGGWWNGIIKTATAGTLNVQWAQLTADAATTTLNAGSYIWLRKLD